MKKKVLWIGCLAAFLMAQGTVMAADKTTNYRVYQNDHLLVEFADKNSAVNYAKYYTNSYVEEIGTRKWVWNNFPRYRVYQYDTTLPEWQFSRLEDAVNEARRWSHASVRDLQSAGWVWNNYPRYQIYQGDITLPDWQFQSYGDALKEAARWANSHIIQLNDNHWVWDNISSADKQQLRTQAKMYQVVQGNYAPENWKFAYLGDAVNESLRWGNSHIVNTTANSVVFENEMQYKVYQNQTPMAEFVSLDEAADYARQLSHSSIMLNGKAIWSNHPYYGVYQKEALIADSNTIAGALDLALKYSRSSIRALDGVTLWTNYRQLMFWGWNGQSDANTVKAHVAGTTGLDADSPTFFQLADKDGGLKDSSNKEAVDIVKKQGIQVHPLIHNQFDGNMTNLFLANAEAQNKFIASVVGRAAEIGVDGLNLDFEALLGKDRAAYTAFVQKFADGAHARGLTLSIDLPRGSVKWNHLGAYDHEKLAHIADYIMIMAYDQYYSGSATPGSVAGLQWAEEGIKEFLSYGIPRDKLIMGIPFYVREWKLDSSGKGVSNRAVYMKSVPELLAAKKAVLTWDASFNQYKAEYEEGGFKYVLWLENEETVMARLDIAKKYDLAGVAAWRLGYDTLDLWKTMLQKKY